MNQHTSTPSAISRRSIRGAVVSSILLLAVIGVVLVLTLTHGSGAGHTTSTRNHAGNGTSNSSNKVSSAGQGQSTPNCYPTRFVHWC
jgi:hypothetical protein